MHPVGRGLSTFFDYIPQFYCFHENYLSSEKSVLLDFL